MSLALGIGIGAPFGREPFNPASLFSASEPGFWADVRPAVLWQDTGRTTPVTAAGQPVASWQLNTASGVIYATQSTAGNRPVYQVDASGRGYLEFDGATSNRWLVTPTITPGTDKVQFFAGFRKLSDAATGMLAETSASGGSGSVYIAAPLGAAANVSFRSTGTVGSTASATVAAPATVVVSGIADIAADTAIIRLNGAQAGQSATDQGTGNFLANPLYIGRRGGSTLPFNGHIYGLIMRFGANLAPSQISAAEGWMNTKTGAY